ncbi:alpha/beta-hydrolase [Violaceomyces palustris]|uniref:Alpha/beta-hydrolase n=1 Tax=Violaceomyces palustris TaxID=1673888 RepID=A0ACD0NRT6_9BASI|nr:alpha/beta-hydrolase [Violaceomyces palustris]
MRQTKVVIPFKGSSSKSNISDEGFSIVGILAQKDLEDRGPVSPSSPSSSYIIEEVDVSKTRGRNLALLLHGVLSHKDQTYHRRLVQELDVDSFRFDFRANHESPGPWSMSSFEQDLEDLDVVLDYLRNHLGYRVQILIAHSRGAIDAFTYLSRNSHDRAPPNLRIPYFVALGARWRMNRIHDRDDTYRKAFETEGFYRWKVKVAGQVKEVKIYPEQVEQFAQYRMDLVVQRFPTKTDTLLIHGTGDKTVPPADAAYFANELTSKVRRPGSFRMHMVDEADHNFQGHYEEVVRVIVEWFEERRRLEGLGEGAGAIWERELAEENEQSLTTTTTTATPIPSTVVDQGSLLQSSWDEARRGGGDAKGKL